MAKGYLTRQGKILILLDNGTYGFYYNIKNFQRGNPPDIESQYAIIKRQIIFRDVNGKEIPERGLFSKNQKHLVWEQFAGEHFYLLKQLPPPSR